MVNSIIISDNIYFTWAEGAERIVENAVSLKKIESARDADHYDNIINGMSEFRTALKNSISF